MNLQECLDKLARGKLSNLSISRNGKIITENIPSVVDAINETLIKLYTIFPIKEKAVVIELAEGKSDYILSSEHSWKYRTEGNIYNEWDYYIIDSDSNPFMDDIINVLEIKDGCCRNRPLNDPDSPLGIYIPEQNLIIVKHIHPHKHLDIIYKAKPIPLDASDLQAKIDLPEFLFAALFSYVAYLIHSNLNTEVAVSNAQKYLAEYQSIVSEIQINGPFTADKLVSDKKFIKRGWV